MSVHANGNQVLSVADTGAFPGGTLYIGGGGSNTASLYDGKIASVRVYKDAGWNNAQVTAEYYRARRSGPVADNPATRQHL